MAHPALTSAIDQIGLQELARHLGVTYQAIRKWEAAGRLPRTEWTGETDYATRIVELAGGSVSRADLLRLPQPASEPAERTEPERAA